MMWSSNITIFHRRQRSINTISIIIICPITRHPARWHERHGKWEGQILDPLVRDWLRTRLEERVEMEEQGSG